MQEVSRMLAEKDSQLPDEFAGMSDEEMKAAQATRNLSARLRSMVKNYEDRPDEKTGETLKKVGIDPETPTTDQEVEAAAEKVVKKQPTGVEPGEKPTRVQPAKKAKQKDLTFDGKVIYGLTSKDNPESLLNILSKAGFEADIVRKVVAKMAQLADDDNIVLEAVSLRGRGTEQDRVMNSESVGELISLVRSLGLDANQNRAMMKALNNWGNRNTVRFEKPTFVPTTTAPEAPTAPAQPEKKPDLDPEQYDTLSPSGPMRQVRPGGAAGLGDYDLPSYEDPESFKSKKPEPEQTPKPKDEEEQAIANMLRMRKQNDAERRERRRAAGLSPDWTERGAEEEDPFDFTDFDEKEAAKEKTAAEEPRMNRDEDIKQTLKKLDRVYSVDDFKEEYLGLLFRTEDWKNLFDNEREAESVVSKAIDNIKENARDIDMALRSETMPSSEIVSFFNNIQNFGNQEAMFTSRLLELALFEYYFDKLSIIKKAGDGSKNEKSYSVWKDGPGKIGQVAIEDLINQNYANRLAARRAVSNTPDTETLQEHKTLNRWKLLAGIK